MSLKESSLRKSAKKPIKLGANFFNMPEDVGDSHNPFNPNSEAHLKKLKKHIFRENNRQNGTDYIKDIPKELAKEGNFNFENKE